MDARPFSGAHEAAAPGWDHHPGGGGNPLRLPLALSALADALHPQEEGPQCGVPRPEEFRELDVSLPGI